MTGNTTLLEAVKIRLKQFHTGTLSGDVVFDRQEMDPLIEQLIKQAQNDVMIARRYPPGYSEDMIQSDLKRFENTVINLAVYDYSQAGEAYMETYSENGISREWKSREKLLSGVYPIARIL